MKALPPILFALLPSLVQAQGLPKPPGGPLDADLSAYPELGFLPRQPPAAESATAATAVPRPAASSAPSAAMPASVAGFALPAATPAARRHRAGEHVLYERRPVPVRLVVGAERLVDLPFVPLLQLPPELEGRLLVQPIENVLYLTALDALPKSRLLVQSLDGSQVMPLDLETLPAKAAKSSGRIEDLVIHLPGERPGGDASAGATPAAEPDMVTLTRFASQWLYAPPRLIPTSQRIRRAELDPARAEHLYRGAALAAEALASWCAGPLCVTAVKLTNRSQQAVELSPLAFRGRWIAVSAQHWRLQPAGSAADTTAAYLVSEGGFADAL